MLLGLTTLQQISKRGAPREMDQQSERERRRLHSYALRSFLRQLVHD